MRKLTVLFVVSLITPAVAAQRALPSHEVADARPAPHVVARVDGVALMSTRLDAALNALIPLESFHRVVNPARMEEFRRQALDRIVEDELQYLAGVRTGVSISDLQVQKEVAAVQRKYGTRAALETALGKSGATMTDLRREVRRTLTVREALRRAVTTQCQVTRKGAEEFFAANPDRFVMPEQLHVYAITIGVEPSASAAQWTEAKQRAEDLQKKIKAGASFEEMARTHSTDRSRSSGGDMGLLHRGAMTEAFEQATRGLAIGQPSEVVQSLYGFHVVEIAEIRPPEHKTFAAVSADLRRDLTSKKCESMKAAWITRLRARSTVILAGEGA